MVNIITILLKICSDSQPSKIYICTQIAEHFFSFSVFMLNLAEAVRYATTFTPKRERWNKSNYVTKMKWINKPCSFICTFGQLKKKMKEVTETKTMPQQICIAGVQQKNNVPVRMIKLFTDIWTQIASTTL